MALRTCRKCGREANNEMELSLFKKHKRSKHGHDNICLDCSHGEVNAWRKENRPLVYAAKIRWRQRHPERRKQYPSFPTSTRKRVKLIASLNSPYICHFCKKEVDRDTIVFHSLDRNHENWSPENKVSAHTTCHGRHHRLEQLKE